MRSKSHDFLEHEHFYLSAFFGMTGALWNTHLKNADKGKSLMCIIKSKWENMNMAHLDWEMGFSAHMNEIKENCA